MQSISRSKLYFQTFSKWDQRNQWSQWSQWNQRNKLQTHQRINTQIRNFHYNKILINNYKSNYQNNHCNGQCLNNKVNLQNCNDIKFKHPNWLNWLLWNFDSRSRYIHTTASHLDSDNSFSVENSNLISNEQNENKIQHPLIEYILKELTESLIASKGRELIVVETRKKSPLCDYMIFVTGMNKRHLKVLSNRAKKYLDTVGQGPCHTEVHEEWGLCDGKDIMVHSFTEEGRQLYQLDRKWILQQTEEFQGKVVGDDMVGKKIVAYKRNNRSRKRLKKSKANVFIPI